MSIPGRDYELIDLETGRVFRADTTVIVPEVLGEVAYDIFYDPDEAIAYGEAQGVELELPEGEGIPVTQLENEPRGYVAIDLDSGSSADASSLVVIPASSLPDFYEDDEAIELGNNEGQVPLVGVEVLEAEGLPYESLVE
jgi:hypothetical protein